MSIDLQPVESSNIAAVGYDADAQTLAIQYRSGGVYHYAGVPAETHADLMGAESIGKFIGTSIRGRYEFEKQDQPKPEEA
jgi:hypothetical protein